MTATTTDTAMFAPPASMTVAELNAKIEADALSVTDATAQGMRFAALAGAYRLTDIVSADLFHVAAAACRFVVDNKPKLRPTLNACPVCGGRRFAATLTPAEKGQMVTPCPTCGGTGRQWEPRPQPAGKPSQQEKPKP